MYNLCDIKLKMIKHYNSLNINILLSIILSLHKNKINYLIYNYIINFMNVIKINSFIMNIVN